MEALAAIKEDDTGEFAVVSAAQKGDNNAVEYLLKKYKRIVLSCVESYYSNLTVKPKKMCL